MGEAIGVLLAIISSALGGTAAAITRYLVGNADAITLAILRWGIGIACVLPTALFFGQSFRLGGTCSRLYRSVFAFLAYFSCFTM